MSKENKSPQNCTLWEKTNYKCCSTMFKCLIGKIKKDQLFYYVCSLNTALLYQWNMIVSPPK